MRKRYSKYDPYKELIADWCAQGVTIREMTEMLIDQTGEDFYDQGLYAYIYRHGLKFTSMVDARRICDQCEYCHKYINTNNTEGRICTKTWKSIQPNVRHSPMWCEYEH